MDEIVDELLEELEKNSVTLTPKIAAKIARKVILIYGISETIAENDDFVQYNDYDCYIFNINTTNSPFNKGSYL